MMIWGLKRCKGGDRAFAIRWQLAGMSAWWGTEGRLYRPADYSLDALVLRPISVLNEALVTEVHIPVVLARVCIHSHSFFLHSIFFLLWLAVVGTVCFLLPSLNFGIFSWPPLLASHVHLVSLKLCGLPCLPSSKHGFTYQAVENSELIQYNRSMELCFSFNLISKMVPLVLIGLWLFSKFRTRLISTYCTHPIFCEWKEHSNCH